MLRGRLVLRLEQALCLWEDFWRLEHYSRLLRKEAGEDPSLMPNDGPVNHFQGLRSYLLSFSKDQRLELDPFIPSPTGYHSFFATLPLYLGVWTASSRRVFHLSKELIDFFDQTSMDEIRWRDINMPFQGFAVTLEEPLIDQAGYVYDLFVASKLDLRFKDKNLSNDVFCVRLFPQILDEYKPISRLVKMQLRDKRNKRKWVQLAKKLDGIQVAFDDMLARMRSPSIMLQVNEFADDTITSVRDIPDVRSTSAGEYQSKRAPIEIDRAIELVSKLCLYLDALSPQDSASSKSTDRLVLPKICGPTDETAIVDKSDIFVVKTAHMLAKKADGTPGEGKSRKKGYHVRAHWRRAHWRRKKGEGNNPEAPKSVRIPARLVNRKRLPENSLPSGSETLMT